MSDYQRIAAVIRYLDEHRRDQPGLEELARQVGLSPHHFQRLFSRWAGVSPKAFLQCLTVEDAKRRLQSGASVLHAALDSGLSGPSRLHDLCVKLEAATPGEIKRQGAGWTIQAGFVATPFGDCLLAYSPRGVCHLAFVETQNREQAEAAIRIDWPRAIIDWDHDSKNPADKTSLSDIAERVFANQQPSDAEIRCLVRGTDFQLRVWRALVRIPFGDITSYQQLGRYIDQPKASRAVGSAVAKNRIAVLVPCHRVIRETGVSGEYRWAPERKKALLAWEQCRSDSLPRSR